MRWVIEPFEVMALPVLDCGAAVFLQLFLWLPSNCHDR